LASITIAQLPGRRAGFTLLELMLVLVLLALGSALAIPAVLPRTDEPHDEAAALIEAGRRAALRRGGAVTIDLARDGSYALEAPAAEPANGAVEWPTALAVRVRISPLGACTLAALEPAATSLRIDPVHCTLHR
jgi:prepilin-type N-terminal cleavage/methylation domain-containing protein